MSKFKYNKGITLLALVVTIVVMLILAGVTTILAINTNLFGHSKDALDATERSMLAEEVSVGVLNYKAEKGTKATKTLRDYLEESVGGNKTITEDNGVYFVARNGQTITVYEDGEIQDGTIDVWDGAGIDIPETKNELNNWNWYIYNCEQLKFFADFVNNGNELTEDQEEYADENNYDKDTIVITADTTVYLMANLDLGAREINGVWNAETDETLQWTPIGDTYETKFIGTFEGNNHTIRGIYVNKDGNYAGFFGNAYNVKNLNIKNSYIEGRSCTAGIIGAGNCVENCHNINTTVVLKEGSYYNVGGVIGQGLEIIKDCSNNGVIVSNGQYNVGDTDHVSYCGGIAGSGRLNCQIINCKNDGSVHSKGGCAGGITGYLGETSCARGCINNGKIMSEYKDVGGIVGNTSYNKAHEIKNCTNNGIVISKDRYVGGIIGRSGNTETLCEECINNGYVSGDGNYIGGIAGYSLSTITKCANTGKIVGTSASKEQVGGIVGGGDYKSEYTGTQMISYCYNSGIVQGGKKVGGIVGHLAYEGRTPTITKCYNKGKVTVLNNSGEIGGVIGIMDSDGNVTSSYYLSNIGVSQGVGAISTGGDLATQNSRAQGTTVDLKTFDEFMEWIVNH